MFHRLIQILNCSRKMKPTLDNRPQFSPNWLSFRCEWNCSEVSYLAMGMQKSSVDSRQSENRKSIVCKLCITIYDRHEMALYIKSMTDYRDEKQGCYFNPISWAMNQPNISFCKCISTSSPFSPFSFIEQKEKMKRR